MPKGVASWTLRSVSRLRRVDAGSVTIELCMAILSTLYGFSTAAMIHAAMKASGAKCNEHDFEAMMTCVGRAEQVKSRFCNQ